MNVSFERIDLDKLKQHIEWKAIEDIPQLKGSTFNEIIEKEKQGKVAFGIDRNCALNFAPNIYSEFSIFLSSVLSSFPIIIFAICLGLSWFKGWVFLFSIITIPMGFFLGNINIPSFFLGVFLLLVSISVALVSWNNSSLFLWMIACFMGQMASTGIWRRLSMESLRSAIRENEHLFILIFQSRGLSIRDQRSGEVLMN